MTILDLLTTKTASGGKLIDRWVYNSRHRVLYGSNILLCGYFIANHISSRCQYRISKFVGNALWTGWLLSLGGLLWLGRKDRCVFALLCLFVYLMPSSSFAPLKEHMAEHRSLQFPAYISLLTSRGSLNLKCNDLNLF